VTAVELGHPVILFILVISGDRLLHGTNAYAIGRFFWLGLYFTA